MARSKRDMSGLVRSLEPLLRAVGAFHVRASGLSSELRGDRDSALNSRALGFSPFVAFGNLKAVCWRAGAACLRDLRFERGFCFGTNGAAAARSSGLGVGEGADRRMHAFLQRGALKPSFSHFSAYVLSPLSHVMVALNHSDLYLASTLSPTLKVSSMTLMLAGLDLQFLPDLSDTHWYFPSSKTSVKTPVVPCFSTKLSLQVVT